MLALFFGLLSLVAGREIKVECRNQAVGRNGGGAVGLNVGGAVGRNGRQCEIVMGDVRVWLPAWAQAIIK
jgi:outer membrane lipoprotein SlyB